MKNVTVLIHEREHPQDLETYASAVQSVTPNAQILRAETQAEAVELATDADVILAKAHHITREMIEVGGRLRWIQSLTTGTDNLEAIGLPPRVMVTSARGVHGPQMSELAFYFMLALNRNMPRMANNQKNQIWERWPQKLLAQKTVVIVGMGAISEELALRCKSFGMRVVALTSTPRPHVAFDAVEPRHNILEAVRSATFVIAMTPYTSDTHHLFGSEVFQAMQENAYFINLARGPVCDEQALLEALRTGAIAGAGLDVFEQEPLPKGHPLWDEPNVVITPHIGGMSDSYAEQLVGLIAENLSAYLGERPDLMRNIVTRT